MKKSHTIHICTSVNHLILPIIFIIKKIKFVRICLNSNELLEILVWLSNKKDVSNGDRGENYIRWVA